MNIKSIYNDIKGQMMFSKQIIISIYIFALFSGIVQAEVSTKNLRFNRLSVEDGLSDCSVNCVLQDSRGFMWFGTFFSLDRYDGYHFRHYCHDPGNPNTVGGYLVRSLWESSREPGIIWVGTMDGGLTRLDTKTGNCRRFVYSIDDPHSLSANEVLSLYEDHQGQLWVGTRKGLNRFDPANGRFIRYTHGPNRPDSLSDSNVNALLVDHEGVVWVGTNRGLGKWNPEHHSFTNFYSHPNKPDSLRGNIVKSFFEDSNGVIWLGTDRGLNRLDRRREKFSHYHPDTSDPYSLKNMVLSIYEDRSGTLWLGTASGLTCFDREHKTFFSQYRLEAGGETVRDVMVLSISQDREGVVWLGSVSGIYKGDPKSARFKHYTGNSVNSGPLSGSTVMSILEDRGGKIWVGTSGGGLDVFTPGASPQWRRFLDKKNCPSCQRVRFVQQIIEDRSGKIWAICNRGLFEYLPNSDSFNQYYPQMDLTNANVLKPLFTSIVEMPEGNFWVGSYNFGLSRFDKHQPDGKKFTFFHHDPRDYKSLCADRVRKLLVDKRGRLWIGTQDGLDRLERARTVDSNGNEKLAFFHYRFNPEDPHSLKHNWIFCLYETPSGDLWVGTYVGLSRLNAQTDLFTHFGKEYGSVFEILEDKSGAIWFSCTQGLCRLNPDDGSIKHFDTKNGLPFMGFSDGSYRSRTGELYFGGFEGMMSFFPEDLSGNTFVPPVYLTGICVGNTPIGGDSDVSLLKELKLSYDNTQLAIEFSALSYSSPLGNRYAYMVEGIDNKWNDLGTKREITFPHLLPGRYTLRVKGGNHDGVWNEEGTSIRIIVSPPFWKTLWFQLLGLVALVFISYWTIALIRKHLTLSSFWKQRNYIGRYRLVEEIGSGGMATVYKAFALGRKKSTESTSRSGSKSSSINGPVALKVMKEQHRSDSTQRQRFINEGTVIDQLHHPNIVRVIERGEHNQSLFIVMELIEGRTLDFLLNEHYLNSLEECLPIMIQLCEALAVIHDHGIIHRDLKPHNIMLVEQDNERGTYGRFLVKLLDFGLAKIQTLNHLTETGLVVGTLGYMSPEQLAKSDYSAASDIYSLGIVFYELVTREKPYSGESNLELLRQIMFHPTAPEPRDACPAIPPQLNRLIVSMLNKFPEKRPSAGEVKEELEEIYRLM